MKLGAVFLGAEILRSLRCAKAGRPDIIPWTFLSSVYITKQAFLFKMGRLCVPISYTACTNAGWHTDPALPHKPANANSFLLILTCVPSLHCPAPALGPALAHALAMLLPCPWPHAYTYPFPSLPLPFPLPFSLPFPLPFSLSYPSPTLAPTPASPQRWYLLSYHLDPLQGRCE